jgi:hypothetical protein
MWSRRPAFAIHEPEFKLFVEPIEANFKNHLLSKAHEFHSISFLSYPNIMIEQIELA